MANMDLKEFIKVTLGDICAAVEEVRRDNPYVAPKVFTEPNSPNKSTLVDFDIAVTASEQTDATSAKSKGEAGFKIAVFNASASFGGDERAVTSGSSSVSRIKFSVPVFFQLDERAAAAVKVSRPIVAATDYDPFK